MVQHRFWLGAILAALISGWVASAAGIAADDLSTADDQRTYDLRYNFSPGETVRTKVVHRATVETSIQGTTQIAETRSTSIKVWRILEVTPEGEAKFEHSVESIDMWQHMKGRQELRYNSKTDKKPPPGYEDVAKAVGVPLAVVTIDESGTVLDREDKRRQPSTGGSPITITLPDESVRVGHVWSAPLDLEVLLKNGAVKKIQSRLQYKLKDVADGIATIGIETQVLTPIHDPALEAQLVQRLSNGSAKFDIAAGRVVSQQMDLDRRVIGFSGPSSSMHYVMRFTEKLLAEEPETAERPGRTARKPAEKKR